MTDFDFLPTEDGATAVLRAGRRRRTAKLTGASSSTFAVALGITLVLSGGPGSQRDQLVPAQDSPRPVSTTSASTTPSKAPVASSPQGQARPSDGPLDPVLGTPAPGATSAPPAQHRTAGKRISPIARVTRAMDQADLCDGDPNVAANGYCLRAFDPGVVHRGRTVVLGGELCVPATGRTATMRPETTREIDMKVSAASGVLWQAGEGVRYTTPGPTITVEPGTCVGWTSQWDTRDREGFVVPPGTYDLSLALGVNNGGSSWGGTITVED